MKITKPSWSFEKDVQPQTIMTNIERYGRTCYKSEEKITSKSAESFIRNIIKRGHESVLEHEVLTVRIVCDRGISHEIVRHRIASFSQESTRYCNYTNSKFGNELTFIRPFFWEENSEEYKLWFNIMEEIEQGYIRLIDMGVTPEQARSILPNSLKTEIVITMNLREWRHFFSLRAAKPAHPQMREIVLPMLEEFYNILPAVFEDIAISMGII